MADIRDLLHFIVINKYLNIIIFINLSNKIRIKTKMNSIKHPLLIS